MTREELLHIAVCQAVVEVARSKEGREAHHILRQALIDHADLVAKDLKSPM